MEMLDPFEPTANLFAYGTGFDQSPAPGLLPAIQIASESPFPGAPPNVPNESSLTRSKLREQLDKLREKRKDMVNRIPEIVAALRDVLQGETPETRKEKMELCIDMIKQLSD